MIEVVMKKKMAAKCEARIKRRGGMNPPENPSKK